MVSKSDKETAFYRRLLAIVQSSLPPEDKMRLIAELLIEEPDETKNSAKMV